MRKLMFVLVVFLAVWLTEGAEEASPPPGSSALPGELVAVPDARYAALEDLAPGSEDAQQRQRSFSKETGLPLEVQTAKTGIALRLVPPGTFKMGSPPTEDGRWYDEGPQREVTIPSGLYVGKYEVTQGQWKAVMGANPSHFNAAGRDAPVEIVSRDDCQGSLNRLCDLEGVPLALRSDA